MLNQMKQILSFFNLLDTEGKLSISNVAVVVVLVKLAIAPAASLTEAGSLLVVLANYAHKRYTKQTAIDNVPVEADPLKPQVDEMQSKLEAAQTKIDEMQTSVSSLVMQNGIKRGN